MHKQRYWLYQRAGIYYLHDSETGQRESLQTRSKREAERIRGARNQVSECPQIGQALAKAYLCAQDPQLLDRTWENVMEQFGTRGKPQTQAWRRRVMRGKAFDRIRHKTLLGTTASDLLEVLQAGGVLVRSYLRCLHNLALGLGWLPMAVLASKLWPPVETKPKRGITWEERKALARARPNPGRSEAWFRAMRICSASRRFRVWRLWRLPVWESWR